MPILLHLRDSNCVQNDVIQEINNDYLEVIIEILDESNSSLSSCWKKSQEILDLSQILPLTQLKRCDIIWEQPSQEGYSIEVNGEQLVADKTFCTNALTWTVEFKFHVFCSDNSYMQPVSLYFHRESLRISRYSVNLDRSLRSTFNQPQSLKNRCTE
ncbi:protocadherin-like wing polarity protein stan [Caerostris extrusa]|uniref:Protocadherin-like wing polarity protein stan n=1 Tax=Caerostris extrusa TaxID=172846 RepID=A0AAV4UNE4_CAEEX|nr:protocadherin-like wing polarity protein stan [Caerostris extrusa]